MQRLCAPIAIRYVHVRSCFCSLVQMHPLLVSRLIILFMYVVS